MSPRKTLASYGTHGRSVRVFTDSTRSLVTVQWRESGRRRTESWPDSPDARRTAKAWARGTAERLERRTPESQQRLTLFDLFDRYVIANDHWREKTRVNAVARWRKFTAFATPELYADLVTPELIDAFRAEMRKQQRAANQIAEHVKVSPTERATNNDATALASDRTARDRWSVEPDVGRVAHGVPARVDRLRGLGNAVVPQVAEVVGRMIVEHAA